MKPSERMKQHLQRQHEQADDDETVAERMARLEREQMEARKQAAALRSGRIVVGDYKRRGTPTRHKRA